MARGGTESKLNVLQTDVNKLVTRMKDLEKASTTMADAIGDSFTNMEKILEKTEKAFEAMDKIVQKSDENFNTLAKDITDMNAAFTNFNNQTNALTQNQQQLETVLQGVTAQVAQQLQAVEATVQANLAAANATDTQKMLNIERKRRIELEKLKDTYKDLFAEKKELDGLDTRTRLMGQTIQAMYDQTGDRKLPFFEGLNVYLEKGGTRAEYFAQFLTSTREELKVFGVEVASVRRFLYGFMPSGTFRLVNKFATALNFVGGTMRSLQADSEDAGNAITRTLLASTFDKKGFERLGDKQREAQKTVRSTTGKIGALTRKQNQAVSATEKDAIGEQIEFLRKVLDKQTERNNELKDQLVNVEESFAFKLDGLGKTIGGGLLKIIDNPLTNYRFNLGQKAITNISKLVEGTVEIMDDTRIALADVAENGNFVTKRLAKIAIGFGKFMKFLLMASMYLVLFGITIFVFQKIFMSIKDRLMEAVNFFTGPIMYFVGAAWNGLQGILGGFMTIITGLFGGDFGEVLSGLWQVAVGTLKVLGSALVILAIGLLGTVLSIGYALLMGAFDWIKERGWKVIGDLVLIAAGIAITLALIATLPVQLPFIIVAAMSVVVAKLLKGLGSAIGLFADGGVVNTPVSIVGERGPELMFGKQGSRVVSNADSKKMMGGKTVNNFNITINAKDTSKAEMRRMADEIGRMISSKINRSTSSSTFR
tara:strand:+ start:1165 stop:3291 length:2127 start_codon:yes stop_codon:yes gene_type:complete